MGTNNTVPVHVLLRVRRGGRRRYFSLLVDDGAGGHLHSLLAPIPPPTSALVELLITAPLTTSSGEQHMLRFLLAFRSQFSTSDGTTVPIRSAPPPSLSVWGRR
jgi:hypothetical protein